MSPENPAGPDRRNSLTPAGLLTLEVLQAPAGLLGTLIARPNV